MSETDFLTEVGQRFDSRLAIEYTREFFNSKDGCVVYSPNQESVSGDYTDRAVRTELSEARLVAMGDAHGSAYKIMETVVQSGLATLSPADAKKFCSLYAGLSESLKNAVEILKNQRTENTDEAADILKDLFKADDTELTDQYVSESRKKILAYREFFIKQKKQIIDLVKEVKWTGGERELVLLGDLIFDRGLCDDITLALVAELRTKAEAAGGRVEIMASNHDLEGFFQESAGWDLSHLTSRMNKKVYEDYCRQLKLCHFDEEKKVFFTHAMWSNDVDAYELLGDSEHISIKNKFYSAKNFPLLDVMREYFNFTAETPPVVVVDKLNEWFQINVVDKFFRVPSAVINNDDFKMIKILVWARGGVTSVDDFMFKNNETSYVHGHDDATKKSLWHGYTGIDSPKVFNLDNFNRKGEARLLHTENQDEAVDSQSNLLFAIP